MPGAPGGGAGGGTVDGHGRRARHPPIFSWAGGEPAFARWLDTFYDLVEEDGLLSPVFGGDVTAEHREAVTAWWSEVMGGPVRYTADHGGYEHRLAKHRGLVITAGAGASPRRTSPIAGLGLRRR